MSQHDFAILDGQTVVFIGDSITDCGRRDRARPFGDGYVRLVIELITARYPERKISYVNRGISGDVITGLQRRWDEDVLQHDPDWVSVLIGINDLHRFFWPDSPEAVDIDTYRQGYEDCLGRLKRQCRAGLILLEPFYICNEPRPGSIEQAVLQQLPQYISVVEELARQYEARHVPLHEVFQKQLQFRLPDIFCPEPVHPNHAGHSVIAEAWLNAMGW